MSHIHLRDKQLGRDCVCRFKLKKDCDAWHAQGRAILKAESLAREAARVAREKADLEERIRTYGVWKQTHPSVWD
jgi:hypothetical protein